MEGQNAPSSTSPAVRILNAVSAEEVMGEEVLYVKVMTDEQMEVLRRQISVYATICEQLVEMHKAITAHNDSIAGMRLGNLYFDPLMTSGGHKITARQRWTPTPVQLQILESIFDQGNGTPSKQKIKEITLELTQHGQISETNVYNWFQNRRARSKRKQSSVPNNGESEAEAENESSSEKRAKTEKMPSDVHLTVEESSFRASEFSSELQHYTSEEPKRTRGMSPSNLASSGSSVQMSFYENILSNPRIDHLMGKMEIPENYGAFQSGGSYDFIE